MTVDAIDPTPMKYSGGDKSGDSSDDGGGGCGGGGDREGHFGSSGNVGGQFDEECINYTTNHTTTTTTTTTATATTTTTTTNGYTDSNESDENGGEPHGVQSPHGLSSVYATLYQPVQRRVKLDNNYYGNCSDSSNESHGSDVIKKISVQTFQTEAMSSSLQRPFTTYKIVTLVQIPSQDNEDNEMKQSNLMKKIITSRRYSEFEKLYSYALQLIQQNIEEDDGIDKAICSIPEFPPKSVLGRFDDEVVEYRRQCFHKLLQYFSTVPCITNDTTFHEFLGVDKIITSINSRNQKKKTSNLPDTKKKVISHQSHHSEELASQDMLSSKCENTSKQNSPNHETSIHQSEEASSSLNNVGMMIADFVSMTKPKLTSFAPITSTSIPALGFISNIPSSIMAHINIITQGTQIEKIKPSDSKMQDLEFGAFRDESQSTKWKHLYKKCESKILFSKKPYNGDKNACTSSKLNANFELGTDIYVTALWKRALRNYPIASKCGAPIYGPMYIFDDRRMIQTHLVQFILRVYINGKPIVGKGENHNFNSWAYKNYFGPKTSLLERANYEQILSDDSTIEKDWYAYHQLMQFPVVKYASNNLSDNDRKYNSQYMNLEDNNWELAPYYLAYRIAKLKPGKHNIRFELCFRIVQTKDNIIFKSFQQHPFFDTIISDPISSGECSIEIPSQKPPSFKSEDALPYSAGTPTSPFQSFFSKFHDENYQSESEFNEDYEKEEEDGDESRNNKNSIHKEPLHPSNVTSSSTDPLKIDTYPRKRTSSAASLTSYLQNSFHDPKNDHSMTDKIQSQIKRYQRNSITDNQSESLI